MSNLLNDSIAGWLIIHTEGKENKTFVLKQGENTIGRASSSSIPDIVIENDTFVSRKHASLKVIPNAAGKLIYLIFDWKSTNGTYVNGNKERVGELPVELFDGETIQIGETKLVLKTPESVSDNEIAASLVKKMEYTDTVPVDNQANSVVLKKVVKK